MHDAMMNGSLVARTQKKYKLKVLQRAQQLAETFLDLLKEGDGQSFEAFSYAGTRLDKTNTACDDMEK
eukprot:5844702-Prorocentrum_lima.AAC.1